MRATPKIGITLGDPAGIGPEIIVKGLVDPALPPSVACILFGSRQILQEEQEALRIHLALKPLPSSRVALEPGLYIQDMGRPACRVIKGEPSAEAGRVSFGYFAAAVEQAEKQELKAIVTAPISKQAWSLAGLRWRGHTEYLAQQHPEAIMAFWSGPLKVALLSHHLPLREALGRVKGDILDRFFQTLDESLRRWTSHRFQFLVAGLNPHAGEAGLMGDEDLVVTQAVTRAREAGMSIDGPFAADTIFRRAVGREGVMVVALYHDQGLIPFKLLAFDSGVNFTLGLPYLRTSPDHGTAYDIAAQRVASPKSFTNALRLAVELA